MENFKKLICLLLFICMIDTVQAQDWPNLNHYNAENTKLGLPENGESRVVFIGSSIIEFWKKVTPDFFKENYINRGIAGQTSPQMLLRFKADVINLKPVAVIILAGSNDIAGNTGPASLETISDNIFSMAELAMFHKIKVILCLNVPVYDFPWKPGLLPADQIIKLNELIKAYAIRHKLDYVDFHTALKDEKNGSKAAYTKDGVHPNEVGYKIMATLCEAAITKVLTKK